MLTSCSLTKKNVTGKWLFDYRDTLILKADESFLFIITNHQKSTTTSPNEVLTGHWRISKRSVDLVFSDTTKNRGGRCRTLYYWWTRGSKKRLVMPRSCTTPTHDFISVTKMD